MNVGLNAADDTTGLRIMSIDDVNNDKLNDLIMVDANRQTVTVFYFDDSTLSYSSSASFDLPNDYFVDNILPTSRAQDLQDLIIVASASVPSEDGTTNVLTSRLFYYT